MEKPKVGKKPVVPTAVWDNALMDVVSSRPAAVKDIMSSFYSFLGLDYSERPSKGIKRVKKYNNVIIMCKFT